MKKIAALLLGLALLLVSVGAFAATPAEVVGTWYLASMSDGYSVYGPAVPVGDYHIELNRDGSAKLVSNGSERPYTWETTDFGFELRPLADEEFEYYWYLEYTLTEEGTITINTLDIGVEDGSYYDFVYDRDPHPVVVPTATQAAQEDDLFGTWYAYMIEQDDKTYNISENGISAIVEYAQITVKNPGSDDLVLLTDFADGAVTCPSKDFDYSTDVARFQPTDAEGVIRLSMEKEGQELYAVYFTNDLSSLPAAPAETEPAEEAVEEETVEEVVDEPVEEEAAEEADN